VVERTKKFTLALESECAMFEQFSRIGRDIYLAGLISSHGGNMSARVGDRILITRRGSMLGRLAEHDIVETSLDSSGSDDALASTEIVVHRAIYANTAAMAVIHTHSPHSILRSMIEDEIVPIDSEGNFLLRKVPVYSFLQTIGSPDVAVAAASGLRDYRCVLVRGHGPFAAGAALEEAFQWITSLEMSCKILNLRDQTGAKPIELEL